MATSRALILNLTKGFLMVIAVWGALAILAAYETYNMRKQAEEFLTELERLNVGESAFDQVAPLIAIYHGHWWRSRSLAPSESDVTPCGYPYRQVEFVFENRWLHWVLFAPRTAFNASLHLKDDRVCFRSAGMITTAGGLRVVHITESREGRFPWPFSPVLNHWKTLVTMTAAATTEQRAAAYSFNLDCLTSLRGCPDAREMAPSVWRLSSH